MAVKTQVQAILKGLNESVIGKEEVIRLSLLSAVAGESIFLLGPPGVAKSLVARKLKQAFRDAKSFEYLMSRFSTPDEIFGPVSISKLKDEDKYERLTKNYLPGADVVFLDEIWKASPSIQNALLTVLNEKVYRNGEQEIKLPLKAIISASNELPAQGEGLEALWDRFLIRYIVQGVDNAQDFNRLIADSIDPYADSVDASTKIDAQMQRIWSKEIDKVQVPAALFNIIHILREKIADYNSNCEKEDEHIYVSDRRWRKIIRILRCSAFLNDRKEIDLMDSFLIAFCIWDKPEQWLWAKETLAETIEKHGYSFDDSLRDLRQAYKELETDVKEQTQKASTRTKKEPVLYDNYYYKSKNRDWYVVATEYDSGVSQLYFYTKNNYGQYAQYGYYSRGDFDVEIDSVKKTYTKKSPAHPAVKAQWNRQIKQMQGELKKASDRLNEAIKNQGYKNNLFVDKLLEPIVERNLAETAREVQTLSLKLRELQHSYSTAGE